MGFLGTVIGGALGFVVGGPVGAAIGAGLGGSADSGLTAIKQRKSEKGLIGLQAKEISRVRKESLEALTNQDEINRENLAIKRRSFDLQKELADSVATRRAQLSAAQLRYQQSRIGGSFSRGAETSVTTALQAQKELNTFLAKQQEESFDLQAEQIQLQFENSKRSIENQFRQAKINLQSADKASAAKKSAAVDQAVGSFISTGIQGFALGAAGKFTDPFGLRTPAPFNPNIVGGVDLGTAGQFTVQ